MAGGGVLTEYLRSGEIGDGFELKSVSVGEKMSGGGKDSTRLLSERIW